MKKLLLLIIIISSCVNIHGQGKRYWKNLEAYVGTWMYQSNDTTIYLKIGIVEIRNDFLKHPTYNMLEGGYKIIINDKVEERRFDDFHRIIKEEKRLLPFFARNDEDDINKVNPDKLRLILKMSRTSEYGDKFPNYQFPGELVLVSKDELIWTVGANTKYPYQPREGRRGSPPSWAYPLPEYAVFQKISDSYD